MRTTKPISTISFNTSAYLKQKLDELTKCGKISFWAFISHLPEDDEGGTKHHHHLYVEPAKMIQSDDLKNELKEFDPERPDKPKGCLPWRSSVFGHWYLYVIHDKRYLASKGESRKYHYSHDDFVASDDDNLLFLSRSIDMLSLSPYADMEDAQKHGVTWSEYFSRGTVPLPQIASFEKAWHLLLQTRTDRGGREGHKMDLNEDTGEVIETPTETPQKRPHSDDEPTWCGATRDEWKELYESAVPDESVTQTPAFYDVHPQAEYVELDPDEELPF